MPAREERQRHAGRATGPVRRRVNERGGQWGGAEGGREMGGRGEDGH